MNASGEPRMDLGAVPVGASNIDCYFGDHRFRGGANCVDCGYFNAPLLAWLRVEKAEREGRHHGNHYHLTSEAAAACKHPTHEADPCASTGGCMQHDASEEYVRDILALAELCREEEKS